MAEGKSYVLMAPGGEVPFHPFDDKEHILAGEHNTPISDPADFGRYY